MKFFTAFLVLALAGFIASAASAASDPRAIKDGGTIQVAVLDLYTKPDRKNQFGKVRIETVSGYRHHQQAAYDPLTPGDEIEAYFFWGTEPRRIPAPSGGGGENYLEIPGVRTGDKIEAYVFGCPEGASCGSGWVLYNYTVLARAPQPLPPSPSPPPPAEESPVVPPEPISEPPELPPSDNNLSPIETPTSRSLVAERDSPPPSAEKSDVLRRVLVAVSVALAGAGIFFIWRGMKIKR